MVNSSPAVSSEGFIFIGSNDRFLYAFDPNGNVIWKFQANSFIISPPSIGSDGTLYVGSNDNNLHALTKNGTLLWKFQTTGIIWSGPSIDSSGIVYVGSFDNYLYAIQSSSFGLSWSPWPKFQHDNQNTGRYGGP